MKPFPASLSASAPVRVDLAGGTLDIFPLEVFAETPLTLNAALRARVRISLCRRRDSKVVIRSLDAGIRVSYESATRIPERTPLSLLSSVVRRYHLPDKVGLEITAESDAPRGSGLGASSALSVALHALLRKAFQMPHYGAGLIRAAQTVECGVIGAPTGVQDYYPALYGGVQALWHRDGAVRREALPARSAAFLERVLVLAYTGQSHISARTNWRVFRDAFENRRDARRRLAAIGEAAVAAREAVLRRDASALAEAMAEEWAVRRGLAAGIETPRMRDMARAAKRAGALAAKACGAGGGGCMVFVVREETKAKVEEALRRLGALMLSTRIARRGLVIRSEKKRPPSS